MTKDSAKIIVVSDSHYEKVMLITLSELIAQRGDIDAVIHLGDMTGDAAWLRERLTIPVYGVPGNCDMDFRNEPEQIIRLGGMDMLICHGHTRRVKYTLDALSYRAQEVNVSLALFGHTHRPCLCREGGVLLLNPGALANGCYAIIEIQNGDLQAPKLLTL